MMRMKSFDFGRNAIPFGDFGRLFLEITFFSFSLSLSRSVVFFTDIDIEIKVNDNIIVDIVINIDVIITILITGIRIISRSSYIGRREVYLYE